MKTIILYVQYNENGEKRISYDPLPPTDCQIRYYLNADQGKILKNIKTNRKAQAIIVPEWEIKDWEEMDIGG